MSFESPTIDNISIDNNPTIVRPEYEKKGLLEASAEILALASNLHLEKHQEGGYFNETDRSPFLMESPYYPGHNKGTSDEVLRVGGAQNEPVLPHKDDPSKKHIPTRNFSTLIHYLLTCEMPMGRLHLNKSRIIHILQRGRGQYVLIYPDGKVKTFVVGFDVGAGEVTQWVVPGGVYKASFLLPLNKEAGETADDHLLISEVVVPGFEYDDHQFMESVEELRGLVGDEKATDLKWLLG